MEMENDAERFERIVSGGAAPEPMTEQTVEAETPTPEAPEQTAEQQIPSRDLKGRFAAKAEEPTAEDQLVEADKPEGESKELPPPPPPHRFREISERARAAEARSAQLEAMLMQMMQRGQPAPAQEKPQAVDPIDAVLTDPESYIGQQIAPVQERFDRMVEAYSKRAAISDHGAGAVDAAYDALGAAIREGRVNGQAVMAHLKQSMDPYGEIVAWHHSSDPSIQREKMRAEILAELQEEKTPTPPTPPPPPANVVKIPPSLNRATSAAYTPQGGADTRSESDAERFNRITARR